MNITKQAKRVTGVILLFLLFGLPDGVYGARPQAAPVTVTGQVVFDTGGAVQGARVTGSLVPIALPVQAFLPLVANGASRNHHR